MRKLFALLLLLACLLAGANSFAAGAIKIGVLGPMSGPLANEGQQMENVVKLLARDLNAKGGLLGEKVEIVVADDGGTPEAATAAAQKLIDQKVVAVIGSYPSPVTEAVQDLFGRARILQISNASTAPLLTEKGIRTFLRTCPRHDDQARAAVNSMAELGFSKVAILHDGSLYSKGLADKTKALLMDRNLAVTFEGSLVPGQPDYTSVLTQIRNTHPDVIFFTGYYPEATAILKERKAMGWDVPVIGGDAAYNPELVNTVGKRAAAGFKFLSLPRPENLPSPEAKNFRAAYKKKYRQRVSSIYALLAGDAFKVIAEAITQTQSTDSDELADYLRSKLEKFYGLTGLVTFDQKGDRESLVFVLYKLDDKGKPVLQF